MSLKSHSRRHSKGTGLSERWLHPPPLFTWLTHGSALLFSWRGEVTRPVRANRLRLYLTFKLSPAYADHALVWSRCKWLNAGHKHWKCWHVTLCNRNTGGSPTLPREWSTPPAQKETSTKTNSYMTLGEAEPEPEKRREQVREEAVEAGRCDQS